MPTKTETTLEITQMITISTAHIAEKTAGELYGITHRHPGYLPEVVKFPTVYEKFPYGYFFYLSEDIDDLKDEMPPDLWACCEFATEHGCNWLCIDADGPVMEGLKTYEWAS